jgi:hypothetical protein
VSAGRRLYYPRVDIRLGVVALLAVCLQLTAIYAPLGSDDLPRRVLFVTSYLLLFAFGAANLRRPGLVVMGGGLLLNFIAIIGNGGLMPVTPQTLERTGNLPADARAGEWVHRTKDVLLERSDIHLYFLADRLVWDPIASVFRAFSVGDVVIAGGLVIAVGDLLLPRLRREETGEEG